MRYFVLACDYDGTLAQYGRVDDTTVAALERVLASGRKLVLVTGRQRDDLSRVFAHLDLFEWVVAENGGLLYRPQTREEKPLAPPPPESFVSLLRAKGVRDVAVGRAIVATWHPHERAALEAIRELGLELQVIFNKDAVMVLPSGINKATGLLAALAEMGLSAHNVVGVGDAENDHAFLRLCECSAAVANALPVVREAADLVLAGDHGAGVRELVDELVGSDLAGRAGALVRHHVVLGTTSDAIEVAVPPYRCNLLVAGPSASGKSTVAMGVVERLVDKSYQLCVIDPEGDYAELPRAAILGTPRTVPDIEQVVRILTGPVDNVVVNLVGMPLGDRPPFFLALLSRLQELRARTGRPHWIVIDEAHHLLPASWEPGAFAMPRRFDCTLLVTVHPGQVARAVLDLVDAVVAVGDEPEATLRSFADAVGQPAPALPLAGRDRFGVALWYRERGETPVLIKPAPPRAERRRHVRKYAEGELTPARSFYFRGPGGALKLRAQNLLLFLQLADGVDDVTWLYHLHRGDYSRWFRDSIKDDELAADTTRVETAHAVTAAESRWAIRRAIEARYTVPAGTTMCMPGTPAERSRVATGGE